MSIFASLALALASQGIVAQDPDLVTGADWTEVAFSELDAGNDQTAIRKLEAIRAESGDEPALLVNLASAYARVGRTEEARVAYYDVLALDDMELELADGRWISSHTIAAVSLKRLASVSVARR